jgi:hypothetical protein
MGVAELDRGQIIIRSHIITYGDASTPEITEDMREEIERMWNEPAGRVRWKNREFLLIFEISASFSPLITREEILSNTDPLNNYFRIENFAAGNISFVDGLGCNTGYFLAENLYKGSTTAAHEYGHTLGLPHPSQLDIRGKGRPGIMYPRGTLVDPEFQYDPNVPAGQKGGTLFPIHRRVLQKDIDLLNLHRLNFRDDLAIVGEFSSVWHDQHKPVII